MPLSSSKNVQGLAQAHAEAAAFVAARAGMYAGAAPDGRRAILLEILDKFGEPEVLRELCADLRRSRRYLDFAFQHNNGFFVLFLADPEQIFQVRLHIWSPHLPPRTEHPHRHRMDFVSRILCGELHSCFYRRKRVTSTTSPSELYQEIVIEGPVTTKFDAGEVCFKPRGIVELQLSAHETYGRGASYYFDARRIHRVETPKNLTEPVVTLSVWAPPFQHSVAYEPHTSPFREGVVPVVRMTGARHDDLLDLVERQI